MLGYVRLYSPRAKETIRQILEKNLDKYSVGDFTDNILTCIDELVKNGLKANYKYALIRERLEKLVVSAEYTEGLTVEEILKDRNIYSEVTAKYIDLKEIAVKVRAALTQEAKVISTKMKALKEERQYTTEERDKILSFTELLDIHQKSRKYGTRVQLRINEFWNALNIEIMNNAPILNQDLERILKKRKEFQEYAERGEEMMFFINNMDDADGGAGLGYATIDSGLKEMGLDPFQAINIISVSNTTILLYFKLDQLRNLANK